MTGALPVFALILFAAALFLLWVSGRQQKKSGLPGGRIIYTDTRAWGPVEKPLYDPHLGLTGKPDYLVEKGEIVIPVEGKSGRAPAAPYDSHIYQLAAYCRLVEQTYGQRPPYGILHYPDRTFSVDYTPELEAALTTMLAEIRAQERHGAANCSHNQAARCVRCGYRNHCDQRLA